MRPALSAICGPARSRLRGNRTSRSSEIGHGQPVSPTRLADFRHPAFRPASSRGTRCLPAQLCARQRRPERGRRPVDRRHAGLGVRACGRARRRRYRRRRGRAHAAELSPRANASPAISKSPCDMHRSSNARLQLELYRWLARTFDPSSPKPPRALLVFVDRRNDGQTSV